MMFCHYGSIGARGSHYNFDCTFGEIFIIPAGFESDNFIKEIDSDTAAHRDNHSFAIKYFLTGFEVIDYILCEIFNSLLVANDSFQAGPFSFSALFAGNLLIEFKLIIEFLNQVSPLFIEINLSQAAFIINTNGSTIGDGLSYIININIITEDLGSVDISTFNGSACETDVSGIRQGIAHILGETVSDSLTDDFLAILINNIFEGGFKTILSAVSFVGDNDYVSSIGELIIIDMTLLREELLNSSKDNATAGDFE